MRTLAAVGLAVAGMVLVACVNDGQRDPAASPQVAPAVTLPPIDTGPSDTGPVTSVRVGPLTPRDVDRITSAERASIELLGASGADVPIDGHGHEHGVAVEAPLFTGDKATFENQWLAAQQAASRFDSLDKIRALGYVRSSAPIAGIGSHWVRWPQLAEPFDPAQPSMLLFDESREPARLVGFSYWLQSPTEPEGFAGPNDHWHQHQGLCVVNGWVDRERATGPEACAGTFLAGGDLWMLHAWPVHGYDNADGRFATFNPKLCPAMAGTPDIARCPDELTFDS